MSVIKIGLSAFSERGKVELASFIEFLLDQTVQIPPENTSGLLKQVIVVNSSKYKLDDFENCLNCTPFDRVNGVIHELLNEYGEYYEKFEKSEVSEIKVNILSGLIKNKVVEDVSDSEIRLRPNFFQKEEVVRGIAKNDFDKIWAIFLKSSKIEFHSLNEAVDWLNKSFVPYKFLFKFNLNDLGDQIQGIVKTVCEKFGVRIIQELDDEQLKILVSMPVGRKLKRAILERFYSLETMNHRKIEKVWRIQVDQFKYRGNLEFLQNKGFLGFSKNDDHITVFLSERNKKSLVNLLDGLIPKETSIGFEVERKVVGSDTEVRVNDVPIKTLRLKSTIDLVFEHILNNQQRKILMADIDELIGKNNIRVPTVKKISYYVDKMGFNRGLRKSFFVPLTNKNNGYFQFQSKILLKDLKDIDPKSMCYRPKGKTKWVAIKPKEFRTSP